MPSWLTDENNQLTVLVGFFLTFIMIPVAVISKLKDANNPTDLYLDNGILKESANHMLAMLKEVMESTEEM